MSESRYTGRGSTFRLGAIQNDNNDEPVEGQEQAHLLSPKEEVEVIQEEPPPVPWHKRGANFLSLAICICVGLIGFGTTAIIQPGSANREWTVVKVTPVGKNGKPPAQGQPFKDGIFWKIEGTVTSSDKETGQPKQFENQVFTLREDGYVKKPAPGVTSGGFTDPGSDGVSIKGKGDPSEWKMLEWAGQPFKDVFKVTKNANGEKVPT
jgi:hypothetical protein